MNNDGRIRLDRGNILIIVLVFLGLSIVGLGASYYFSSLKNDSSSSNSDKKNADSECNKNFNKLSGFSLNTDCTEFEFYISDTDTKLMFGGTLTKYDKSNMSEHYTLKLNLADKDVTTDFFTNKEKLAIFGNSTSFFQYDKYLIVRSDKGSQINGGYVTVVDSTNGNVIFVYEDGHIIIDNDTITITKSNDNVFCDDTNGTLITGKTYVYKLSSEGITLNSEKNNTCAD